MIDEALEILKDAGPEFEGELSNHGPMAAEALVTLGRMGDVIAWVENYRRKLQPRPASRGVITRDNWQGSLGDIAQFGGWADFFKAELNRDHWTGVLNEWAGRLMPGLMAAATHGIIRTAQAARSLGRGETELRLDELAEGLAYWAARYQPLPQAAQNFGRGLKPSEAITQVETLPRGRQPQGLSNDGLRQLDGLPSFAGVINLVEPAENHSGFLSDMTEAFAGLYLANADDFDHVIIFIHSVTGTSAIRLMMPYLAPDLINGLLRYGWQAGAALYAAYGKSPGADSFARPDESVEGLVDRSVATGDEHAIKFTEACLREYAINPKPVYLAAARHAADRLAQS